MKHELQDERFHEEKGTAASREPPAPEDREIQRTRLENGGLEERNQDHGEGRAGQHGWTEGKAAWKAGKVEKSKPGAENLRSTAERMG